MKLSDQMLFAHPVLSRASDDFRDADFGFECNYSIENNQTLNLELNIKLSCPELVRLIDEGAAGCGFFLICRETYQNRLVAARLGHFVYRCKADDFFGTVQLRCIIWSNESRSNWSSNHLHPEYDGKTDFPAFRVLAFSDELRFSLDRERLKPFESIFSLAAIDRLEEGEIRVDPDGEKITIGVSPGTKRSIDGIRNDRRGRAILLNAVYLPAVIQVLIDLTAGQRSFDDKPWFRIFSAKCAQCGIDPANAMPLEHAQLLLGYPFLKIDEMKEILFS